MPDRPWYESALNRLPSRPEGGSDVVDSERAPMGAVLFEFSWEVCNQLGGIYQVLRSKAKRMAERWRNRYFLVGPYVEARAALEFEPKKPTGWIAKVVDDLGAQGVIAHHGRWLIPGRPRVLLLEFRPGPAELQELKYFVWEHHGIETPGDVWMIDGVVALAEASRRLLHAVSRRWAAASEADAGADEGHPSTSGPLRPGRRVVAHFHEWLAGLAIPMIRRDGLPVATVFTTHATILGRSMAWNDEAFYDHLPWVNQAEEAGRFNVRCQHAIERAAAHGSDVFTTVSPITGEECTHLLGRGPDLILPNGISVEQSTVSHEFQNAHGQFKDRIHRFVMGHFFPSYSFDLDRTLYFFTSGRFEPRNKGFDLCLEAMARLNAELKASNLGVTVVFFVVTQRPVVSLQPRALENRGILRELRAASDRIAGDIGEKLFRAAASGSYTRLDDLADEYWALRLRRTLAAMRSDRPPLLCTHVLEDEANDPVLNHIRSLWFANSADDPVKIVYHPAFINPANPLWGLEYEQFVRGCHLGVFPSAYEPWGYTPVECVIGGVPAITSDLAGFGRYVEEYYGDHDRWGLRVLNRRGRSYSDAAADLARMLLAYCRLDRRERVLLRNEVQQRSWAFDWGMLGQAYDWAHDLAMARAAAGAGGQ
ncbi:MAG: glycogen/starch synthase [Phycisphaeraceae bacterium]|nr:glycogen/starch synthase [Phycisphaeraceae bacterium]